MNNHKESVVVQKYLDQYYSKPSPKQYKVWDRFKEWLKKQDMVTEFDFNEAILQRQKTNKNCSRIVIDNMQQYKSKLIKEKYEITEEIVRYNFKYIGRMYQNGVFKIIFTLLLQSCGIWPTAKAPC